MFLYYTCIVAVAIVIETNFPVPLANHRYIYALTSTFAPVNYGFYMGMAHVEDIIDWSKSGSGAGNCVSITMVATKSLLLL